MRSALIIAALLLFFAAIVQAQSVGCCCDPVVRNGSFSSRAQCDTQGFAFVGPPPDLVTMCGFFCNASLVQTAVRCGDGVCQLSETTSSCPADCVVQGVCGNPDVRPAPLGLSALPLEGKKGVRLEFTLPCPSSFVSVERCKDVGCLDFALVAQVPNGPFVDEDPSLEFNRDYTYRVVAFDRVFGASEPAFVQVNLGDVECLENPRRVFCISKVFYGRFEEYLMTFGYGLSLPSDFSLTFSDTVSRTFASRLNQPWQCDSKNRLVTPAGQPRCGGGQVCVADERGARCVVPQDCVLGAPFGLLGTKVACETQRYCFFDKSGVSVDDCLSCSPSKTCNEYRTRSACEADNCGAGICQWKPIAQDLGTGVCVDIETKNCAFCVPQPRESLLLDACTESKSAALSTSLFPCFFDKDRKVSKSCSEATCADYTQVQCGSSAQGIHLSSNNSLLVPSADPCNIRVCEYNDATGCVKNADGSSGASFQDCRFGNKTCEADYFAPITTLVPNGTAGKIEFLNFNVFDKESVAGALRDRAGKGGYVTYVCVKGTGNLCREASLFTPVVSARLVLSNRVLKEGNRTLAQFASGNNTVAFYSRDPANNVEVVKEAVVFACDNCNGPIVVNLSITQGNSFGTRLFTASTQPTITFGFDGPTTITYAELKNAVRSIPLQQLTNGSRTAHQFRAFDLDGEYELYLNAFNERSIYMDPRAVKFELVVDTSVPQLTITPVDGEIRVLQSLSPVDVLLNFSGQAVLRRVVLAAESFADPFVKQMISRDIAALLRTTNNLTFSAGVPNVTGGPYALMVFAEGFNSLPVQRQSKFFIASQPPNFRLAEPAFGVTPFSTFNVTVETPLPSQCAYVYDTPQAPNSTEFMFFNKLSGTGLFHSAQDLTIPFNAERNYLLHVYCNFDLFNVKNRTFAITFDAEPPFILNAFAEPSVISERFTPEVELYLTTLKVQLDKPGFCKYSRSTSEFGAMEGFFSGFDELAKEALAVEVNVSSVQNFTFFVSCKGKNQLVGDSRQVSFAVDLSRSLNISSSTPRGFATANFSIGVVANKRVICYFGEQEDDVTTCMGACKTSYGHNQDIIVSGEGEYAYFVQCIHPTGNRSEVLKIPVFVDTSPPVMEYVTDDTTLPENRNISWSLNRVHLALKGTDEQSGVAYYLVSIQNQRTRQFVVRDKEVYSNGSEPFYVDLENASLADGEPYVVTARAVNNVGLRSEPLGSDGVSVDVSKQPSACSDGEQTSGESDVDCGGSCEGCGPGKSCLTSLDCDTNYCAQGKCELTSCTDAVVNGVESDIDCGGKYCSKCGDARSCRVDADCGSDYCDPVQKRCAAAPACADKQLTQGESDVDCGGPCDGCLEGKTCQESSDCASGLNCGTEKLCSSVLVGDEDADGVVDGTDGCPQTPLGESVDEKGCAPSQVSSLNDGITDKWRLDYFGCVECDEAAADNDADVDELTNLEEFKEGTNPVEEDSDGDGWADGDELESGTNPVDPASHPSSSIGIVLWVVFALLAVGGIAYGGYLLREARKPEVHAVFREVPVQKALAQDVKLRSFARKEDVPDGWLSMEQLKSQKQPIIAVARPVQKDSNPLNQLKSVVKRLSPEDQEEVRVHMENVDLLSKKERDALFEKLKITASYYDEHKREVKKGLKKNG